MAACWYRLHGSEAVRIGESVASREGPYGLGTNLWVRCWLLMLNEIFLSLSDPTRRAMVERLRHADGIAVGDLADGFGMSLPAAIKHIDRLCDSGLVRRERSGRHVFCHLERRGVEEALAWLTDIEGFWVPRLDRLAAEAERIEREGRRRS